MRKKSCESCRYLLMYEVLEGNRVHLACELIEHEIVVHTKSGTFYCNHYKPAWVPPSG